MSIVDEEVILMNSSGGEMANVEAQIKRRDDDAGLVTSDGNSLHLVLLHLNSSALHLGSSFSVLLVFLHGTFCHREESRGTVPTRSSHRSGDSSAPIVGQVRRQEGSEAEALRNGMEKSRKASKTPAKHRVLGVISTTRRDDGEGGEEGDGIEEGGLDHRLGRIRRKKVLFESPSISAHLMEKMTGGEKWVVTYTKHLTQKRKVFHDGVLELVPSTFSNKIVLLNEDGSILASRFLKKVERVEVGLRIDIPNFIVEVIEPMVQLKGSYQNCSHQAQTVDLKRTRDSALTRTEHQGKGEPKKAQCRSNRKLTKFVTPSVSQSNEPIFLSQGSEDLQERDQSKQAKSLSNKTLAKSQDPVQDQTKQASPDGEHFARSVSGTPRNALEIMSVLKWQCQSRDIDDRETTPQHGHVTGADLLLRDNQSQVDAVHPCYEPERAIRSVHDPDVGISRQTCEEQNSSPQETSVDVVTFPHVVGHSTSRDPSCIRPINPGNAQSPLEESVPVPKDKKMALSGLVCKKPCEVTLNGNPPAAASATITPDCESIDRNRYSKCGETPVENEICVDASISEQVLPCKSPMDEFPTFDLGF